MPKSDINSRPYNKPQKRAAKQQVKTISRAKSKLAYEAGMNAAGDFNAAYVSQGSSAQAQRGMRKYLDDIKAKKMKPKRGR